MNHDEKVEIRKISFCYIMAIRYVYIYWVGFGLARELNALQN